MKNFKKIFAAAICLMVAHACVPAAFAADVPDATIHKGADCSLTVWKYDWTNAKKDGVWGEDSFTDTGWRESYVEDTLGNAVRTKDADGSTGNDLGNGQNSNGYAIKGAEFTVLRAADIVTFTESANDRHPEYNLTQVLYGFDRVKSAALLKAIGLGNGAGRYDNADHTDRLDPASYYYTSDTINRALSLTLEEDSSAVKDALESYILNADGAVTMDKTDENGRAIKRGLPIGLYLCVETQVPEMVTSTTPPFFVSLPMTTVSGDGNSSSPEGGHQWNYDVVVYPKQDTGIPTLEKTVREAKKDTGKNGATDAVTDGFSHNATGSGGDTMEYQIISTLPTITSKATALCVYSFYDSLSGGLSYHKTPKDVRIEFFTDKGCTDRAAAWEQDDGRFTVTYSGDGRHMSIDVTKDGLDEINGNAENANGKLYKGYSNYTARVTYTATVNTDSSFVYGDSGNDNKSVLTWKRTSLDYYDTLIDDAHVYSFGIDITKLFSSHEAQNAQDLGMFGHVKFKIRNETDGYWLTAKRNDEEGVYYVTGHAAEESDAAVFHPVTCDGKPGQVMVKGCEDDEYVITEVETADGYTLLKDDIHVRIAVSDDTSRPCGIYSEDTAGILQNDPRYSFDGGLDLKLANIPQKALSHNLLTASSTVDGNPVGMLPDKGSYHAHTPLTVVNTRGFDLPKTGDHGTWMFTVIGTLMMAGALCSIIVILRKKNVKK